MKWKLALLLVVLALPGVVAVSWMALPLLVDPSAIPVPLETLQVATAVQGTMVVLIAAVLGAVLGPKIGLSAPALSAMLGEGGGGHALRPQLLPGLVGGILGAGIILGFYAFSPDAMAAIRGSGALPITVRVLYGGITEEVLIRWGLMTLLLWIGWRFFQAGAGKPSGAIVWAAIAVSSLLFGIAHVPSVAHSMAEVPASVIVYITVGNALFGLVAGCLFWRYGLEAAIVAHILAHVFAYLIRG